LENGEIIFEEPDENDNEEDEEHYDDESDLAEEIEEYSDLEEFFNIDTGLYELKRIKRTRIKIREPLEKDNIKIRTKKKKENNNEIQNPQMV